MTETTTSSTSKAPKRSGFSGVKLLENYALLILTALVFLFFTLNPESSTAFPTVANLNVILGSQAVVSMIALAALFPIIAGYFDFSLGAIAATAQVAAAGLMANAHAPFWVAVTLPIIGGGLIGVVNGLLVARFQMPPFVTTLGVAILLAGLIQWYTKGQSIVAGIDPAIMKFGSSRILGFPTVVYVVLLVAIAAWYFFTHTPYGRSLYAIGSNVSSAKLVGIRVDRSVWSSFIIAGVISGGAGVMQLSRQGSATAGDGNSLLFAALAAVFLGATAVTPGFFNVIGTIVGALFVSISVSGLTLSGASGWASPVFNGLALLIAVGLSTFLGRRKRPS